IGGEKHFDVANHCCSLADAHAKYAIELVLAARLRLLGTPQRGCGEVLVNSALKTDIALLEKPLGAQKLAVEIAEGGAAVAGDKARGVEPVAAVQLLLHQAEPHPSLKSGHENVALAEIEFVVQCDVAQRHTHPPKASLPRCSRYFQ